jgi:DNA-binding IclR family transcriptional regulator
VEEVNADNVFELFSMIYCHDVKFLVIRALSEKDLASLREIARRAGVSPKTASKYVEELVSKGIVEVLYDEPNIKLYRLSEKAILFKKFFERTSR